MSWETQDHLYLGRLVRRGEMLADAFFYPLNDLMTHAVCMGMTGSGKTGLGIALLEEATLQGISSLVIDPKGDLTNLLLAFPRLQPADFRPWTDGPSAQRLGLTPDEYAEQTARLWREELSRWNMDGARVARFQAAARFVIYTPGSDAGRPVNVIHSLRAPALDWSREAETLRETISSTVAALLALLGIESDPISGREHSLLSTIIEQAWRAGQDMDLAQLIVQVHRPPLDRLGVLPLEVFYPEKERVRLMMALNGLLASPQFSIWLQGDPLSVDDMIMSDGRPQVSIFSLAHLSDVERTFFVTLLLDQVRSWLRRQPGVAALRALLYVDELYGLMPPHPANPPAKKLLLSLLKQARSQGLGVVLATQNPVDLDYKGLSNIGSWFIGKLQTANDRQRALEGLAGMPSSGASMDRSSLDALLAQLRPRHFLLYRARSDEPVLFQARQTMCYLPGPLTRAQIRQLMAQEVTLNAPSFVSTLAVPAAIPQPAAVLQPATETGREAAGRPVWQAWPDTPPVLPAQVRSYFWPVQTPLEWAVRRIEAQGRPIIYQDKSLVYRPAVLARALARIDHDRRNIHERVIVLRALPLSGRGDGATWRDGLVLSPQTPPDDHPAQNARFAPLPAQFGDSRRINSLQSSFLDFVYHETVISLLSCSRLNLVSAPGEAEARFRRRCYQAIEQQRDAELARIDKSYQVPMARLQERIRREERELEQDQAEYDARKREEMISAGESIFNWLAKRRSSRMLSTASRKRRLTEQSKAEVDESVQAIQDMEQQIQDLLDRREQEQDDAQSRWRQAVEALDQEFQTIQVRPRKTDIMIEAFGVVWLPYWDIVYPGDRDGVQQQSIPAFETFS